MDWNFAERRAGGGVEDGDAGVARAGNKGFSGGEHHVGRFVRDAQGVDDDALRERDDGDGIRDFIDDPDFIVGAGADADGGGGDRDFTDQQRGGAGWRADVEDGKRVGGRVEGEEPLAIGGDRQGVLLACLEMRLGKAHRGDEGEEEDGWQKM